MTDDFRKATPVMEGMWRETADGGIVLLGSICDRCGEVYFPKKETKVCAHCQGRHLSDIELSREGVVHSVTVVEQKPAGNFYFGEVPFIYAIVEFPEGVYVQGHALKDGSEDIRIGDRVRVVPAILGEGPDGIISTYKFRKLSEVKNDG